MNKRRVVLAHSWPVARAHIPDLKPPHDLVIRNDDDYRYICSMRPGPDIEVIWLEENGGTQLSYECWEILKFRGW